MIGSVQCDMILSMALNQGNALFSALDKAQNPPNEQTATQRMAAIFK